MLSGLGIQMLQAKMLLRLSRRLDQRSRLTLGLSLRLQALRVWVHQLAEFRVQAQPYQRLHQGHRSHPQGQQC